MKTRKKEMSSLHRITAILLVIFMLVVEIGTLVSCGPETEEFEILFNADGENYATIITPGTETIQIPENPSKDGYTFDGWYWDKDVWSKPFTANSLLDAPISSDMSVYAKFTPIPYSISYEMDGGAHNNPATYTIESSFEFANAQKAGYTFLGWYTDATYTTQIKSISAGTTGDMTLYAKFELATYSITYENTKGAENINPIIYTINSETITFSSLSKDGYTFGGWYVGDTKVMEISKGSTGNLTLTAKWDTIGYTLTYHNVAGATHANPDSYDVEDQPLTLSAASKAGYRFVGWYTDEALTKMVTEIAVGTTGNLNLYAKWEAIEYTATFKDGDTVVGTVKFTVETDSITEPAVPEHAGYTGVWENYTLGHENLTINAVYDVITFTISDATNTNIKETDVITSELLGITANSPSGHTKTVKTTVKFGHQTAGTTMIVTASITDAEGNITTKDFEIKIYGVPNIILNQDNRIVYEDSSISTLFIATDSFGVVCPVDVIISGEQIAGNTVIATVSCIDESGNITTKQYAFGVLPSEKSFVELYVEAELWQVLFIENAKDYMLPVPEVESNYKPFGWIANNDQYTDSTGKGLLELPSHIQLNFFKYESGYTPIATPTQLANMSVTGKYILVLDLDIGGTEWIPIGTESRPFVGMFDGNGHTISNFKVTGEVEYVGLFGYNNGIIKNIGVKNITINVKPKFRNSKTEWGYTSYYYYSYVGALVGYNGNTGIVLNCYAKETDICDIFHPYKSISGNDCRISCGGLIGYNAGGCITRCYAIGSVIVDNHTGTGNPYSHVGGLIGYNTDGSITACYATENVVSSCGSNSAAYNYVGGLIGLNTRGIIINSYATGDVSSPSGKQESNVGGLIGDNTGTITNCYATGNITSIIKDYWSRAGGLIGTNAGTIMNCYATGNVNSSSNNNVIYAGGLIGSNEEKDEIVNCYRYSKQSFTITKNDKTTYSATNALGTAKDVTELQSVVFQTSILNWNNNIWAFVEGTHPILKNEIICNDQVVEISTIEQLLSIHNKGKYVLTTDLDLGGMEWIPVPLFEGTFDGNGHTISNFKISGVKSYAGLFGYNTGTIKNIGVKNITVDTRAVEDSLLHIGGLVGYNNHGTVSNCFVIGSVTGNGDIYSNIYVGQLIGYNNHGAIKNCHTTGEVKVYGSTRFNYIGGMIGYNYYGSITRSYTTCTIEFRSISAASTSYIGGLVGLNSYGGSISKSYATGNVGIYSSSISNFGASFTGGLVGYNSYLVTDCYRYNGQTISGKTKNTLGTEKSMSELKSVSFQTSSLGWSADDWNFVEGQHPTLKDVDATN